MLHGSRGCGKTLLARAVSSRHSCCSLKSTGLRSSGGRSGRPTHRRPLLALRIESPTWAVR
ncbi:MAG: AAA family ATPase [Actinomycetota bacterium]|nr:AAA family ATPase [Actinomycetota bacterium]